MACGFYLHLYRKQFLPAFGKLDVLCSIFRVVPILALTATATKAKQKKRSSIPLAFSIQSQLRSTQTGQIFRLSLECDQLLKKKG